MIFLVCYDFRFFWFVTIFDKWNPVYLRQGPFIPKFVISQHGDKIDDKDKINCPEGWEWTGNWQVDDNRAVDDEGTLKTIL